jgi:hypothetical protein
VIDSQSHQAKHCRLKTTPLLTESDAVFLLAIQSKLDPVRTNDVWYVCFLTADGADPIFAHFYSADRAEEVAGMVRKRITEPFATVVVIHPDGQKPGWQ